VRSLLFLFSGFLFQAKEKGCTICGYINVDLPRFFDMDHLFVRNQVFHFLYLLSGEGQI